MDIQTRKIEFIQSFLKIQSEKTLSQFESLLQKTRKEKSEKNSGSFSREELNKRVTISEMDFDNNRFKTSEELLEKY